MPDTGPQLEVRGAQKRFGRIEALAGVSLSLDSGEWVGLVGPNGAGKTTLMGAVAGLVRLDQGEIRLLGSRVRGPGTGGGRALGVVPQAVALYGALTARENLRIFGRLHGLRGRALAERVVWALDWTRLADRADRPVDTFSGGMKRRLNIACAVLHQPRVVLLDEPTVGVDPQGRSLIWEMLEGLRAGGASLLQSSHQLDELETRCDRLVVVDHGRVAAAGTLDQIAGDLPLARRAVRLVLEGPLNGARLPPGFRANGRVVRGGVNEASAELAGLLERLRAAGLGVSEVELTRPSLEEVFLHLTGTELRE